MIVNTDSVTMPEYDRTAMTYTSHDNLEKAAQCAGACVEQRVVDGEDQVGHPATARWYACHPASS